MSNPKRQIVNALEGAGQTRLFALQRGLRHRVDEAFGHLFADRPAMVVADRNTLAAAGRDVIEGLRRAGRACREPWVFEDRELAAGYPEMETVRGRLASHDAVAVAVGSGTINDLVKLASHELGRPYMVVATAASMDGYAAFGASITRHGSKQTFSCPAPSGIMADPEVIEAAPVGMNASGYADLLAKNVAGADWILADALGLEPIDAKAWDLVQGSLNQWTGDPAGVARGDSHAIESLMLGLISSGCAMQWTKTSRPASGAEHQFSHLWDMQHHVHQGRTPSHGFKVGIGMLASSALYEALLAQPLESLDVERAVAGWPSLAEVEAQIRRQLTLPELAAKAVEEMQAKYLPREALRGQLTRLRRFWPGLKKRLREQLVSNVELRRRLAEAGCPVSPETIGISSSRLRGSYFEAYFIRRRFTVLDLAVRTGLLDAMLDRVFDVSVGRAVARADGLGPVVSAEEAGFSQGSQSQGGRR